MLLAEKALRFCCPKHCRYWMDPAGWMNSPFYYIKQNDQIYVEPNNPQVKRAGYITNIGTLLSVISVILSTSVLILR